MLKANPRLSSQFSFNPCLHVRRENADKQTHTYKKPEEINFHLLLGIIRILNGPILKLNALISLLVILFMQYLFSLHTVRNNSFTGMLFRSHYSRIFCPALFYFEKHSLLLSMKKIIIIIPQEIKTVRKRAKNILHFL